jgi:hypothetical protein
MHVLESLTAKFLLKIVIGLYSSSDRPYLTFRSELIACMHTTSSRTAWAVIGPAQGRRRCPNKSNRFSMSSEIPLPRTLTSRQRLAKHSSCGKFLLPVPLCVWQGIDWSVRPCQGSLAGWQAAVHNSQ